MADLKYKSTVERARALIAIAHPDSAGSWSGKCPSESPGLLRMLDDLDKVPLFLAGPCTVLPNFAAAAEKGAGRI